MSNPWDEFADSLVSTVKERTKKFVEENAELDDFVKERLQALAKAAYEYKTAPDDHKESAKHELNIIRQTIENKLVAVALHGQREQQKIFREIFFSVINTVVKSVPTLLAMI